jgi:hypothetical protein
MHFLKVLHHIFRKVSSFGAVFILFVLPASTTYKLNGYGFGSGGVSDSASTNYKEQSVTGEISGQNGAGTTYNQLPGLLGSEQAGAPLAPTFTNPSNYYNKLQIILAPGSSPSDATYAIAISSDGFSTTDYVKSDNTVGGILASTDYQTYSAWGGSSGFYVIGLAVNTTYTVKVKATQGRYTEGAYSVTASASTVAPALTFDIDVATTDIETSPPYAISVGSLLPATVTTATNLFWVDFDTNGLQGGAVYISGQQGGLHSGSQAYTITSATADLTSATEGFGVQISTATQASGGPFNADSPYNVSSENVGVIDTTVRKIFDSSGQITSGRGSVYIKAKASSVTPAASDYTETFTIIASAAF